MSIFEAIMLICFGFAWPFSIYKSAKSKTAKGKSLLFLIVILLGYISGVTHKLLYSRDIALIFYIINTIMVLIDICFYFYNSRLDKQNKKMIN
jgi:hypothetical protein